MQLKTVSSFLTWFNGVGYVNEYIVTIVAWLRCCFVYYHIRE